MKHGYTSSFLLKYLYRETSATKTLELENAISEDPEVKAEYKRLLKGFRLLPKVKFYPSDKTILGILNHSKKQLKPSF